MSERVEVREQRRLLEIARAGTAACYLPTDEPDPLVSVCIPTFERDRAQLARAVRAALAQTHQRLEVVVVSDGDGRVLESIAAELDDPRFRFTRIAPVPVSRARRGLYARYPNGGANRNLALALARGAWIAPSDDDDEMVDDHVESLLREARVRQAEFVYSQARAERAPGVWQVLGEAPLRRGASVQGTALYSAALRFVTYRSTSWKLHEWDDWNFFRRMRRIGVRIAFLEQVTYIHYLEGPIRDLLQPARDTSNAG